MRAGRVAIIALVALAGTRAEAGQPRGCWALRDPVERLACFDMAYGPPEAGTASRGRPERVAPASNGSKAAGPAPVPAPQATPD